MSKYPPAPAPISAAHMDRIEQDAQRGIGASSTDTLRLVGELSHYIRDPLTIESHWVDAMFNIIEDQSADYSQLEVENARLRGLLAEKVVTSTMLTGLVPDDGGMTLGFEGGACGMLAQVFGDQFYRSQAVNYLELRFDSAKHPELGPLVVTLQRVEGKTPHQLREVAEAQVRTMTEQVTALQSDANSWQSGYDEGRRMGTKTMLETRTLDARRAGFWRSPKDMPPVGAPVVVLRDAGTVGNGQHAGHRAGRWLELTTVWQTMFACDAVSTGQVIGWVGADEFQGLEALRKDADRYRWLRVADWWRSPLCVISNPKEQAKLGSDCPSGERLDESVDAALSKELAQ